MLKKLIVITLLLLPFMSMAQKSEIGIAGGIKAHGGYIGSIAYYLKVWKVQVGVVGEVSNANVVAMFDKTKYVLISPGLNVNYTIPFKAGYFYPGIAARYTVGKDVDMRRLKGIELGVHTGVVLKLVKSLSLNAEIGLRVQSAKVDVQKIYLGIDEPTKESINPYGANVAYANIPIMVGLRWSF